MKTECHDLAAHILSYRCKTESERWLKSQIIQGLTTSSNVAEWTERHLRHLEKSEVLNPYLRELTTHYEEN